MSIRNARVFRAVLHWLVAALFAVPMVALSAKPLHPWPTKQFEIRAEIPPDLRRILAVAQADEQRVEEYEVPPMVRVKMQQHLTRVARYLESVDFRPPNLAVEKSRDNAGASRNVYVVYLYNYPGGAPASYSHGCAEPPFHFAKPAPYIRIDTGPEKGGLPFAAATGEVRDFAYQLLTHELFHAVQHAYPFFRLIECAQGAWISEGTARAFEVFVEEELRGRRLLGTESPDPFQEPPYITKLQPRAYNEKLHVERELPPEQRPRAYGTASFWMYLAEMAGAGSTKVPTLGGGRRDYRYLQRFFESSAEGPGHEQELRWLNAALKREFKRSLPSVYAEFVTMMAGYVPARAGPANGARRWRERLFGTCPRYALSESAPRVDFTLVFEPVSARCVDIALSTREEVELIVIGRNKGGHITDVEALAGIFVGVPGLHVVDRADIVLPADIVAENEKVVGIWRVPFDPVIDQSFTISSIANVRVANPRNGPIAFTILHPEWHASLTHPPAALPPARSAGTGTPDKRGSDRSASSKSAATASLNSERRSAAARASRNLDTFSRTVRSSTGVRRSPDEGRCDEPFKFEICGPHTTIALHLSPGTFFDLGATSGRGGDFAQFAGNLMAAHAATGGGTARIEAWIKKQASIPGHQITMTFPLIDYGFTGTFHNAYIEAKVPKGDRWVTVGPQDAVPGPGSLFAFSGRVTIHEYTPEVLRGEFGGALVNLEDAIGRGDDPVLPVRHRLSGRFVIAAPLLDDDRTHWLNPISYRDVAEDFEIIMPGMAAAAPDPLAAARAEAARSASRQRTPSASGHALCDCSCNRRASASDVCSASCRFTYQACAGVAFIPPPLPTALSPSQQGQAIAELRRTYYDFLLANNGRAYADTQIRIFDSLPDTLQDKRRWMELGGASDFIQWERAQGTAAPAIAASTPAGRSPGDEAAAVSALRERFRDFVARSRGERAAKSFVEVYDLIPGALADKRKWIEEAVPEFE